MRRAAPHYGLGGWLLQGSVLIVLLAAFNAPAFAGTCNWQGEADDPFTHQDGRYLSSTLPLNNRRSRAGLNVHHMAGDAVRIGLGFDESGASIRQVDATIQFLLDDAAVVELHLIETSPPTQGLSTWDARPTWGGFAVIPYHTTHLAVGNFTVDDARRIASGTIKSIRHDLFNTGATTFDVASPASRKFASALACAIGP